MLLVAFAALVTAMVGAGSGLSPGAVVWLSVGTAVGLLVLIAVLKAWASDSRPSHCQVCGVALKRLRYVWTVADGATKTLCANCNRTIERRKSKEATDRFLGG